MVEIKGFSESIGVVLDLESTASQFLGLSGWSEVCSGSSDPALLAAWGLPAGACGREILLRPEGEQRGGLRLVELAGAGTQRAIRSNPQVWDTGGYLDLNIRVEDMESRREDFYRAGWRGTCDPVTWQFGDKTVCEWLTLGPDGLALAIIERLDPPLPPGAIPGGFGPIFNSTQTVADMAQSLDFYERVLGFTTFVHIRQPLMSEPSENVLGIPHNIIAESDVEIAILSPNGEMDGSIELIQMHGLKGRDFRDRARPPNLGLAALRFPVTDIAALHEHLVQAGVNIAFDPIEVDIAPGGRCQLMAAQAPEGAWLEFYQVD